MLIPNKAEKWSPWGIALLFQQDEVPLAVICDNAKEMVLSKFNRKLKGASISPMVKCSQKKDEETKEKFW